MKPNLSNDSSAVQSFRKVLFLLLFILAVPGAINSQDFKKFAVGPGLSINVGVFNPEAVNQYIENALSNYDIIFGTTDMILYYEVSGFLNFKTRWVDISPVLSYAISPKIIVGAESFYFKKISPGALANFHIPIGLSGKKAIFIGGGLMYNIMNFEDYEAKGLGYRVQMGFDLQFGGFNLQPVIAYNIANEMATNVTGAPLMLKYTGGQIGVIMSFHKPVSHRSF